MKHPAHVGALVCFGILSSSQLFPQVISRTNAGFNTPESVQVNAAAATPFASISSISAQDINGDGKIDLLVSGPNPTGNIQPGPITTTLLQNAGNENFTQIFGNNSSYCQPAFEFINSVAGFCTLADVNHDGMPDEIFAVETINSANSDGSDFPDSFEVDYPEIKVQLATGPGAYAAAQKYVLGGKAKFISAIATGDFNGDGRTDIAVLLMPQTAQNSYRAVYGQLVILFGNGDGGFSLSHSYTTSTYYAFNFAGPPSVQYLPASAYLQLAALDLNGDGKSDLIVYGGLTNNSPTDFYYGTSSGLSLQPIDTGIGSPFSILVPADFQGEGVHDLVALETDGTVHVLLWGGPGSAYYNYFKSDQQLNLTEYASSVQNIALADFNRDGHPDIVVESGALSIFLGSSSGTFSNPRQYPVGNVAPFTGLAIADFNDDGKLDIATGSQLANIYYGDGSGSFTAPAISTRAGPPSPGILGSVIVSADFNRDGHADIAMITNPCSASECGGFFVNVFLGSGAGWFQAPVSYPVDTFFPSIGTGDVNGDGIPDLVTIIASSSDSTNHPGPDTSVLLGQPGGTFAPAKSYTLGVYGGDVILRDVNNDGKLDLITDLGINLGNGNGTFGSLIPFPITPSPSRQVMAVGDFNNDGKLDILYSQQGTATVMLGDGSGHFTVKQTIRPQCPSGVTCTFPSIAVGNLNDDKDLDFVALTNTTSGAIIIPYLGNGDGTFREGTAAVSSTPVGFANANVALEDVNGDGISDVVINADTVLLGKGNGTFSTPLLFPGNSQTVTESAGLAYADFNSDGAIDVAVPTGTGFARVLNTGFKTWLKPSSLPTASPLQTSASTEAAAVEER